MEKLNMAALRRYTIRELEIRDEDLQAIMTLGFTASGTFLNLLKLDRVLKDLQPEIKIIYSTFAADHLRIVKKEDWEEYNRWRKSKGLHAATAVE